MMQFILGKYLNMNWSEICLSVTLFTESWSKCNLWQCWCDNREGPKLVKCGWILTAADSMPTLHDCLFPVSIKQCFWPAPPPPPSLFSFRPHLCIISLNILHWTLNRLIMIIIIAVISVVPYLTKGEHTTLYKTNKNAYIKTSKILS